MPKKAWSAFLVVLIAACPAFTGPSLADRPLDPGARLGRLNCEAGEVPQFDGTRWRCARLPVSLALRDADGDLFGTIISFEEAYVNVAEIFELPSTGEALTVLLKVNPSGFVTPVRLTFENTDCTGTGGILNRNFLPPSWGLFHPGTVHGSRLYVLVSESAITITIPQGSDLIDGRCFQSGSTPVSVFEVELVDTNIFETFPPPFTIELQTN